MKKENYLFLLIIGILFTILSCKKEKSLNTFTDPRDNEVYRIVTINSQTWFAENLRYITDFGSIENPNNPDPKYGRLYKWIEAKCPPGWRLPSDRDWNILETSLGMNDSADWTLYGYRGTHGVSMKSNNGWVNNGSGDNSSEFNVYPSGRYSEDNTSGGNFSEFTGLGEFAIFWTSSTRQNGSIFTREFQYNANGVLRDFLVDWYQSNYLSCRCIKN
jgi:uncharacterized protein (TIGR02145 family)